MHEVYTLNQPLDLNFVVGDVPIIYLLLDNNVPVRGKSPDPNPKKIVNSARNPKVTEKKLNKTTRVRDFFFSDSGRFLSGLGPKSPITDSGNVKFSDIDIGPKFFAKNQFFYICETSQNLQDFSRSSPQFE